MYYVISACPENCYKISFSTKSLVGCGSGSRSSLSPAGFRPKAWLQKISSPSSRKPSLSRGIQAEPGRNITRSGELQWLSAETVHEDIHHSFVTSVTHTHVVRVTTRQCAWQVDVVWTRQKGHNGVEWYWMSWYWWLVGLIGTDFFFWIHLGKGWDLRFWDFWLRDNKL